MMNKLLSSAILASLLAGTRASPAPQAQSPVATSTTSAGAPTYTALNQSQITALQQELIMAPSQVAREKVLFPDAYANPNVTASANNVAFQFLNPARTLPADGNVVVGSVNVIPGLIGTDVAFAMGFIGPCGLNVPHLHPRANEFLTVVNGTLIGAFLLEEDAEFNGTTPEVALTLTNFTGMLFPKGHIHWQFNPTCDDATFAAGFDSSDEGRFQVAQTFFSSTPDDVVQTAVGNAAFLGPAQIDQLRNNIPAAFVEIVQDCAAMCKIPTS